MDQRKATVGGDGATAQVTGCFHVPPEVGFDPARQRDVCQVEITTGKGIWIPVVAYDELAQRLAATRSKSRVRIEGRLVGQSWTTGDNKKHTRLVVEAETLTVIKERSTCRRMQPTR